MATNALILCKDFRLAEKKTSNGSSHLHYRKGNSYLTYITDAIGVDNNNPTSSEIWFREGNAIPIGAPAKVAAGILNETWLLPKLRGLQGRPHGRGLGIGISMRMAIFLIITIIALVGFFASKGI